MSVRQNHAGNCTDITLLDRLRASFTTQCSQRSYATDNKRIESHEMPLFDGLISDGFDHNLFRIGDFRLNEAEFAGDRMRFIAPSEIATSSVDVDRSFSLNSSCSPATMTAPAVAAVTENTHSKIGRESSRKRKAEFGVEDDDCKDNVIEGELMELESEVSNRETSASTSKENSKGSDVQKLDYIHVRARRGQATDSHSLAERARREKISKKMKCLQDLVPGCDKVTGKAGMIDEIINYVQSLQNQVEFLSMKLATYNPTLDFNIDNFLLKELTAASEMTNLAYLKLNQAPQGGTTSCGSADMLINNCTQMEPQRISSSSMSIPEPYFDSSSFPQLQPMAAWENDLQGLYNTEFR